MHDRLDNGEYFMWRRRQEDLHDNYMRVLARAQQQAIEQYNNWRPGMPLVEQINPYDPAYSSSAGPPTPGERSQPEDTTGLKLLEELLAKRKEERDGDKRK